MRRRQTPQQITEGVIWKQLLIFFFPILLGSFFQQMYNTVDTIVVGRFVGTTALAAVGSTTSFINLVNGFFIGLSTGATVIISQYFGAHDEDSVDKALHTGMALSLVLGAIIMVVGFLSGPWILEKIQTPAESMEDAVRYAQVYFLGAIASMVYNMGAGILRAMGDSRRPMIFLIVACVVNIFMDVLCVVVLKMGVVGAAIATVFSQFVSAILVVAALMRLPETYRLSFGKLRMHGNVLKRFLQVGIPAGLQFTTFDLSNMLIQSGINSFGAVTTAAWTAISKTDAIIWMINSAFGVAITTFVGQNFGARKFDRVRRSVWVCLGMSVCSVAVLSVLVMIFREFILGIYVVDTEVIKAGAYIMMWISPFYVLFMPVEVFAGAMRGTGYSVVPTVISCVCVCVMRVLWVAIMVSRFHTVEMLALAYPVTWAIAAIAFFVEYLRGKWLKKPAAALQ